MAKFPKLVVLSTLLTWAGCGNGGTGIIGKYTDFENRFRHRSPAMGCANLHAAENTLYSMRCRGHNVSLIGIGLVYGNCGFDFENIFRLVYVVCEHQWYLLHVYR